jgi:histidine triad (HIT) family protein
MNDDCLFCKISAGRSDTEFLYETDTLVVFKDINPAARIHLLIVPKKHIRSINDLTDEDRSILADLIFAAKHMAAEMGVAQSGYRLFFNVERGGGQVIFHLHMHLIAR